MVRKLSNDELIERQKQRCDGGPEASPSSGGRLPFSVVLNDIRSLHNVGSIFRTCDGAGVEKVWLCGITGYPPNQQIAKTALGAQRRVPWEYREDVLALIGELKREGYQIVLLEQTSISTSFDEFKPNAPVCLVLGNEIEGVSQRILAFCDAAIEIEMAGVKNSLNVSVAFGIAAYHLRAHLKKRQENV